MTSSIIQCLVVDDKAPARAIIRKFLSDIPGYEVLEECKNAFEANEAIQNLKPDLLFLDINMPKLSGLQLLKTLKRPPLTIITTAYRDFAVESFDLDVIDYLHKPFSLERFMQALNKANARHQQLVEHPSKPVMKEETDRSDSDFIFLKDSGQTKRVDLRQVLYIEALGDYLHVVTLKGKHITHSSMKKMEELLTSKRFCRIHKSFIINLSKIDTIEGNRVYIGEHSFPVGVTYRSTFRTLIKSYMS